MSTGTTFMALVITLVLCGIAFGQTTGPESGGLKVGLPRPGGAFNLRILSDSVPDFSTRENFNASALSHCATEQDKAITQWRWSYRCRRVGSCAREDGGRPVLDPVLFFNSYGVTYCSMISQINCSLWEARGMKNRVVDLVGHVVSEIEYDGAWHLFDNDFCNYFLNEKGQVASVAELAGSRIHGNIADLNPGEFYIFDHCPAASCVNGRIFMGPSSASLIEVARDWYPGPGEKIKARPRLGFTGSQAGHRYILGLRPGESYIRYWHPIGTGETYARLFPNGKDPMEEGGQLLRNCRGNGQWGWFEPDMNDPATFFAVENVSHQSGSWKIKDSKKPAYFILHVVAGNVIVSGGLEIFRWDADCKFAVSGDNGLSWTPVKPGKEIEIVDMAVRFGLFDKPVAGRADYLLRIECDKQNAEEDLFLPKFRLETITQVNPRTLPGLKLGPNEIVAISDGHYETMTFNPRLSGDQASKEVFKVAGFQGIVNPTDTQPALHSTGDNAELVLKAQTPRPIKSIRMASTLFQPDGGAEFFMHSSFDGGKNWNELRHDFFKGWPADHRHEVRQDKVPAGARDVQMKYSFDSAGCGLVNVVAEVNYEPAGPFMPFRVSYQWREFRDGMWVRRMHEEFVDSPYHKYSINVGGTRPPRMDSVEIEYGGRDSGYFYVDDRHPNWVLDNKLDPGPGSARPGYRLVRGNNVARGCKYEANRPASAAFPDVGGKLLTDGMFQVSSYWGLEAINLTGKKNDRRVGDLAVWESQGSGGPSPQPSPRGEGERGSAAKPDDLLVTIDLGKGQTIGGTRICALQPNEKVLYPKEMIVETSADGKTFAEAGRTNWEECFFPPADELQWEGADSPLYEKLPAGGILDYKFPVVFAKPIEARYVRFRMTPSEGAGEGPKEGDSPLFQNGRKRGQSPAAVALWELEVYDTLKREPFEDKITLPGKPK